jgi:hypothetical protein
VCGATLSPNFPTTPGAYDTTYNGGISNGDAFVTRFGALPGGSDCHQGQGDGEAEGENRKAHFHFHQRSSCEDSDDDEGDNEEDNVRADDDRSGSHFRSTAITASTFDVANDRQTVTVAGAGIHNGRPVTFTMIAVNYGGAAPALFQITMSDGYTFTGKVVSGGILIR